MAKFHYFICYSFLPLIFYTNYAFGSANESCIYSVEIIKIHSDLNSINPLSPIKVTVKLGTQRGDNVGPCQISCKVSISQEKDIELKIPKTVSPNSLEIGKKIKVHHYYSAGTTVVGSSELEFWELKDG